MQLLNKIMNFQYRMHLKQSDGVQYRGDSIA